RGRERHAADPEAARLHARHAVRRRLLGSCHRRGGRSGALRARVGHSAEPRRMKIVVIGNGMVGQRFLEQLVGRGAGHEITVFGEEPRPAYDRVQLTSFFSGKTASELNVVPESFFQNSGITLRLNDPVQSIDLQRKLVRSARYRDVAYDKLVIATG